MKKLNITETLISGLIDEVVPLVERVTKWNIQTRSLCTRVLPKDRGYEEVLLGRLQGAGIYIDEDHPRSIVERLIEYVVEANICGAYQPSTQEILIIRENVDESNLEGLKVVVAHELVHRGQHVNFPNLFDQVDEIIREFFNCYSQEEANLQEALQIINRAGPIMTLLESHAHYVQDLLRQSYFPEAKIETHFNLATLLMQLFGRKKISQYTEGIPEVAAAIASGKIDSLYSAFDR